MSCVRCSAHRYGLLWCCGPRPFVLYPRWAHHTTRYGELERVLALAASADSPRALADAMKAHLMRRLWRLLLCRVRCGLMWIDMLRRHREQREKAMALLQRNVHRRRLLNNWAALIQAEGARVEAEAKANAAASTIAMWLFRWCLAHGSRHFELRHPTKQPRRKVTKADDDIALEVMRVAQLAAVFRLVCSFS